MFGPDLGFLDPYEYEIYNKGAQNTGGHHHLSVQAFDAIKFIT